MSLNIGTDNSRFVRVKNPTIKLAFSDKVIFADLITSKKTGRDKLDKDSGEPILGQDGQPIPERIYFKWEGRFVGDALEAARAFSSYQVIDIETGWIEQESYRGKDGKNHVNYYVVISDFNFLPDRDFNEAYNDNGSSTAEGEEDFYDEEGSSGDSFI